MDWIPLDDYKGEINIADRPRKLTHEEIVYIVSHFPTAPSADSTAAQINRDCITEWMVETLREVQICPSAIPDLIANIIKQHNKSLVVPGTPVGIAAGEAVGSTSTQMTLNSVAPWEKLLIQNSSGSVELVMIGDWIDNIIASNPKRVINIPENRTQYIELLSDVYIPTPAKDGRVTWDKVTAVTKHIPVGDLVKVTTSTGRQVTATQSKSLLVWNGDELVQREGSSVKVGDLMPILGSIPDPKVVLREKFGYDLDYIRGYTFGEHYVLGITDKHELCGWFSEGKPLPLDFLVAPYDFLFGFMSAVEVIPETDKEFFNFVSARIRSFAGNYEVINDVLLDPIVSIEHVPATEYVYDLTVPTTTNFSLWNGLGTADTFHASGSSKSASFGIEAMRDLIFASKKPKNESSTIYFTDKTMTYEDVLNTRSYIVGSVVKDFILQTGDILHYDIDDYQEFKRYWWHDTADILFDNVPNPTKVLRLYLNTSEMYKHRVSIKDLANSLEREIPPSITCVYGPISDGIIDLYCNPSVIGVSLKNKEKAAVPLDLIEATYLETIVVPELDKIRVKGISGIKSLYPIVSPVWRMVLLERQVEKRDNLTEFLGTKYSRAWLLFYNKDIMRITGLIPENLSALCAAAGIKIIGGDETKLVVAMPQDRLKTDFGETIYVFNDVNYHKLDPKSLIDYQDKTFKLVDQNRFKSMEDFWIEEISENVFVQLPLDNVIKIDSKLYKLASPVEIKGDFYEEIIPIQGVKVNLTKIKPSEYVSAKVSADKAERNKQKDILTKANIELAKNLPEHEKQKLISKYVSVPRSNLMKAAEFVIAETEGTNLKELMALPGVDKQRTTCNNMYTITETLGIESARTFLIRALINTIANTGSYIHPTNIMVIAEFITSRGEPYGATYTGISRQPGGHISLATVERAGKVFTQNALYHRKEDIRNVSASVALGARMAIGTGFFDVAQDIIEDGLERTVINEDLFTALANDDASKILSRQLRSSYAPPSYNSENLPLDLEDLKSMQLGDLTFDLTGGEDETDYLRLFNTSSNIPTQSRPDDPIDPVRQPVAVSDLIKTLGDIKIDIPVLDASVLSFDIPAPPQIEIITAPIISTGLVTSLDFTIPLAGTELPSSLQNLLDKYLPTTPVPFQSPLGPSTTTIQNLPTLNIVNLPQISQNLSSQSIELRREQVRDLLPS